MHVILSDNVMLYDYPFSIDNINKHLSHFDKKNFLIINIDTANIDVINKKIYDKDYSISVEEIETVLPRVDTFSDKLLCFTRIIRLNSNAKIFNKGIYICNNKLLSAIHTSNAGINTIPTYSLNLTNYSEFKDFPYIVKSTEGYAGREVFKVDTETELLDILNKYSNLDLIIQPFRVNGNVDYRIIVGNGKVLASFKRTAKEGDFKANTSQGGKIEQIELSPDIEKMAIFTADVLKMDFVGLDFLIENEKFEFCEANNSFKISTEEIAGNICNEIEFIGGF